MRYVVESHAIELRHMVIVQSIVNLPSILAAAYKPHLTQSAQLMRNGRLGHSELNCDLTDIHFAFKQNGYDPQARRVAEGAEQVSQMGGGLFFE